MNFLVDESVFAPMAEALKRAEHDVLTAKDAGLLGQPDERIFAQAIADKRVLLTLDTDFTRTARYNPRRCGGIVVARLFRLPVDEATRILVEAISNMDPGALVGRLAVITREGVRMGPRRGE